MDPAQGKPIVYLVNDEEVVRDALARLLRSRRVLSESFPSADAFEAWLAAPIAPGRAAGPMAPACLVLDVRMPGASGLVLFGRLAERGPLALLPVIFLTGQGDVPSAVAAVKRGEFDFVEKPFSDNLLGDRVEQALAKGALALAEFTEREREVMQLGIEARPYKLMAHELAISGRTVEVHRARVFDKMHVKSAVELATVDEP